METEEKNVTGEPEKKPVAGTVKPEEEDGDSIEKYIEQKKLQNRILKELLEKISQSGKK